MIKKGNHSLHALGTWDQAGAENVEVWDHTDNNSPVKLIPVKEEAVKENHPMKLVPDKKEEAVGNNNAPVRLNPAMVEAVGGNHPVKLISAKKEAVKENTFSEQLIPVKEEVVKENYPEKENQLKDAVENKPVTLQDVVKDSKLKDAVEKKPVESPAIICVGIEYAAGEARTVGDQALHTLRVGDQTDALEIEEEHCLEAVLMNTASAHTFDEGYITAEKQGEVAENINGSGGGHAPIQVFRVGCLSVLRGGDQNRTKSVESFTTKAVENDYTAENIHPKKLKDAGKDGDDPVRLRDVLKENQLKDAVENNPNEPKDAVEDNTNKVGDQNTVHKKNKGENLNAVHKKNKGENLNAVHNNNPVKENQ